MNAHQTCPECGTPLPPGALEGLCPACLLRQGAAAESGAQGGPAEFEPLAVEEVARLFPQLEILQLIGKGGMGAIYKARQPALDRLVALKILPSQRAAGASFAERFNREARALARLSHPNIVAVHEFGRVEGLHFFLMEYVDGVNLRQLQQADRLSARQALEIVPQICDALQYAHDEGVVHRDIKPENVLIDRKGKVKIADFGLAKILEKDAASLRLTGEGQVMGTPHYMAPEQVEHPLEVDHRADIYALGVVFYEMLTGELPLGKFSPPSRKVQVDVRLDDVVLRALEKEPELRYQQASQVKTAVAAIADPPQVTGAQAPPIPGGGGGPPTRPALRRFAWSAAAGLAVFLTVFVTTAVITASLPRTYVSVARIQVERAQGNRFGDPLPFDPFFVQTEFEVIRSREVAMSVVERLGLTQRWAERYGTQSDSDAVTQLIQRLDVRQTRNTSLIEIRFYSERPEEAAEIANAIAGAYHEKRPENQVSIVDRAQRSERPVRPNVPQNLAIGALVGAVLGLLTAGLVLIALLLGRNRLSAKSPGTRRLGRTWKPAVAAALAVALGVVLLTVAWGAWRSSNRQFNASSAMQKPGPTPTPMLPENPSVPLLQFRLVAEPASNMPTDEFPDPNDPSRQRQIRVLKDVLLGASAVTRAGYDWDPINGRPQIRIRLNEEDGKRFEALTGENIDRQLAILIGDRLLTAPVIRTKIPGGEIVIQGNFTDAEGHAMIDALNKNPIPNSQRLFSPATEAVLPRQSAREPLWSFKDLDTGRSVKREGLDWTLRESRQWLAKTGVDICPIADPRVAAVVCFDMITAGSRSKDWNGCTPQDVLNNWSLMTKEPVAQQPLGKDPSGNEPDTYLFRTREDGWGVLQIIGSIEDPPGVKIRYKLVAGGGVQAKRTTEAVSIPDPGEARLARRPESGLEIASFAPHSSTNHAFRRPDASRPR